MSRAFASRIALSPILLYSCIALLCLFTLPRPVAAANGQNTSAILGGVAQGAVQFGLGQLVGGLGGQISGVTGGITHPACVAETARRASMDPPQPPPHGDFPCIVPITGLSGGVVQGVCMATKCLGVSAPGLGGGSAGVSQSLGGLFQQIASQLVSKLMQGGQSGSGGAPTSGSVFSGGCSQYYQVTSPSSDPCAYYVPPVSDDLTGSTGLDTSISDQLLDALGGSGEETTPVSEDIGNVDEEPSTPAPTTDAPKATIVSSSTVFLPAGPIGHLASGVSGDIKLLGNGATILAGSTDAGSNTTVAGFYGSDTMSGQPQGLVAGLCRNRPWAGGFLSKVIPETFFDGLCSLRGYQVGVPQPTAQAPSVTVTQTPPAPVETAATTTSTVPPKVSIWASPDSVPLGSRTSIFWTSQGVSSCTETSPDGSFSEATLSGGASTVPITGATVFSISCTAPDGSHVTDDVTVTLAI